MPTNNTVGLPGRFCNHVIRNLYVSFLAQKADLKVNYSYESEIERLGIQLYKRGKRIYDTTAIIRDNDFMDYLERPVNYNLFVDWCSAQNHAFAMLLFNYFRQSDIRNAIQAANIYKESNNYVFAHIRLDDVITHSPGYVYYDKAVHAALTRGASGGYVSSDSPQHPFVTCLAEKYGLTVFKGDEVTTIMRAAACKHLILSYGTFSWLMGALAYDATVYIPPKEFNTWCGDIFNMPSWEIIPL